MLDRPIVAHKGALIEKAYSIRPFTSFADLGGCWGVNGGYAFRAIELCGDNFLNGFIVDQNITPLTLERAARHPDLTLVSAMLGSQEARDAVSKVDMLIMFDILLHQVSPNWDKFLDDWLRTTDMVVVYNQNWIKSDETIRFIDMGLEWFKENVVFPDEGALERWFATHDEFDSVQGKYKRDIHNFWQWGITPRDLVNTMADHKFEMAYMNRYGAFQDTKPWIVNDGFVFIRSEYR